MSTDPYAAYYYGVPAPIGTPGPLRQQSHSQDIEDISEMVDNIQATAEKHASLMRIMNNQEYNLHITALNLDTINLKAVRSRYSPGPPPIEVWSRTQFQSLPEEDLRELCVYYLGYDLPNATARFQIVANRIGIILNLTSEATTAI